MIMIFDCILQRMYIILQKKIVYRGVIIILVKLDLFNCDRFRYCFIKCIGR